MLRTLFFKGLRIGLVGLVALGLLGTIGYANVRHVMSINFRALYQGYALPPSVILNFYLSEFGPSTVILSLIGYVAGIVRFRENRPAVTFLAALGPMSMLFWVFGAQQVNPQSNLHFVPTVFGGIAIGFAVACYSKPVWRRLAVASMTGLLLLNFVVALCNVTAVESRPWLRRWLADPQRPMQRPDCPAVAGVVDYLRSNAAPSDIILVFASSGVMNEDLLRHADLQLHERDETRLNVLPTPQIDSRDYYPLECLLFAKYVVLAHPFQSQLPYVALDQQRVASVGYDMFAEKWEIADDFKALPKTFLLQGGVKIQIYERIRPTSPATALRTLLKMEAAVGHRPGTQLSWIFLNGSQFGHTFLPEARYFSRIGFQGKEPRAANMLCIDRVPRQGEVRGKICLPEQGCLGARVILSALATDGKSTPMGETTIRSTAERRDFSLAYTIPDSSRLVLTLAAVDENDASLKSGSIQVHALQVIPVGEKP
jgi:hypothetical protein